MCRPVLYPALCLSLLAACAEPEAEELPLGTTPPEEDVAPAFGRGAELPDLRYAEASSGCPDPEATVAWLLAMDWSLRITRNLDESVLEEVYASPDNKYGARASSQGFDPVKGYGQGSVLDEDMRLYANSEALDPEIVFTEEGVRPGFYYAAFPTIVEIDPFHADLDRLSLFFEFAYDGEFVDYLYGDTAIPSRVVVFMGDEDWVGDPGAGTPYCSVIFDLSGLALEPI